LEPEGYTELHFVEQIAVGIWRLRRVDRAELGEIRKQLAMPEASDIEAEIEEAYEHFSESLPELVEKSSAGIPYLRTAVEYARDELESEGTVSEKVCYHLGFVFSKMAYNPATKLRDWFHPEECDEAEEEEYEEEEEDGDSEPTPTADEDEPDKKAAARKHLEMTLKDLDRRERKLREQERTDLEIARQRLSIPQSPELEHIQRYRTAINRDMSRAIDQLERLQRRRRSEPLLPTVNVNVSKDD
jgi:hypothetical protein